MRHLLLLRSRRPIPINTSTTTTILDHSALLKMRLQRLPTLSIIPLLHLLTSLEPPLGQPDHVATLEHERHAPLADLLRLEIGVAGLFVRGRVGSVGGHDVVQRGAGGLETPARFGVVGAVDQAHEFGHCVAVVPWWAEGLGGGGVVLLVHEV